MMTVLASRQYSGHHKDKEKKKDQRTPEKRLREKYVDSKFQIQLEDGSSTTWTELVGEKWSVAYVPSEATRRNSRKSIQSSRVPGIASDLQ